ncbi:kinesin-like protein [Thermoascus aurantiacus ATCC 26904]
MNPPKSSPSQASLFEVYLRLRPPYAQQQQDGHAERFLTVEPPETTTTVKNGVSRSSPTQIILQPPNDSRKRAVEKFAFTKVFEENVSQLDVFKGTGIDSLIEGVLCDGRDGMVATLGVTGSGKSHTIFGSKTQRGLTQMALDVIFRSLSSNIRSSDALTDQVLLSSLAASDPSEAQIFSAQSFLESVYGDPNSDRSRNSRAQTPMTSSRAQTPMTDTIPASIPRRHPLPRPSALPQGPDVSHLAIDVDSRAEHVVLVSMYEVYNDRIYDLLCPSMPPGPGARQGINQKDRRRPLIFKSTENSPDRKVVAGLRKVVCRTYEEALMVLETGLMERRVTGTGSNSASSRSHGFFCVEVRKKVKGKRYGEETWTGTTLTVVDLAGSERARAAKTAGATLAEAGKINESLMYLGQCLQMQSDIQDGKTALVPFRQCKLTELLFSNSFPTHNQVAASHRHPQKAIMIVTADPLGDFNATSQILRYAALAREVTVPRMPSVATTILSSASSRVSGRSTPHTVPVEELEAAAKEIARITEEYNALAVKLAEEEIARAEAEMKLKAAEERCLMIEQDVREECWAEMDERMEEERRRWQLALDEQIGRSTEHLDKKLELLSREIKIYEDPQPSADERIEELERENEELRRKIAALERELMSRSPTKKTQAKKSTVAGQGASLDNGPIGSESNIDSVLRSMDYLKLSDNNAAPKAPLKKQRKMTTRKWDLGPEDEI